MTTMYTIAGFYAAIGSVWALYVQHANRDNETYKNRYAVWIGLAWPITLPLCLFLAWNQARWMKREVEELNRKLEEGNAAREKARAEFNQRTWYETDDPEDWDDFWNGS